MEPAAAAAEAPIGAIEAVLLLFLAATALAIVARRIGIPYPILLVLGGLALGFVPGLPRIELEPDIVFLLFLPPILFGAGYFTSIRDFKANLRAISSPLDRPRPDDDRRRRGGRPGAHSGPWLAGRVRPWRDRGAAGRGRRDGDLPAARRAAAGRHDPRGREPRQRRDGPRRLSVRDRRGDDRGLLAGHGRHLVRPRRGRRRCPWAPHRDGLRGDPAADR